VVRAERAERLRRALAPRRSDRDRHGLAALTRREREVVRLAVDGLTAREIGAQLFISERTVETHLANAYGKLGVASRLELARLVPGLS
jgi:DNA-binding NarL/FixJ family response regulator